VTESESSTAEAGATGRIRSSAQLVILSAEVSPGDLATAVGLAPDESWRKGDRQSERVRRTRPLNGIVYESGLAERLPPHDHLVALIERLGPYSDSIAALVARPSTESVTVWLVEHTESDMTDISASPEQLSAVGAMGAWLVASSYFYPRNDDE
jgi:hypothetical protein